MQKESLLSVAERAHPAWFNAETGIYRSPHAAVALPADPLLDLVSFIFSHRRRDAPHTSSSSAVALLDSASGDSITYQDLFPLVKSTASALQKSGIRHGDAVLLVLPNSIHFPVVFLAVLYAGAVVTTMNPLATVVEIQKRIADCGVRLGLAAQERATALQDSALGIPFVLVPESNSGSSLLDAFGGLIGRDVDSDLRPPAIRQQDAAAIMYSSGTTGASKGAVLTHGNLIAAVELFVRFEASTYDFPPQENVYLAVLPMFHIYGLVLFVAGLLSLGSTIVVMKKFDVGEVIKAIERHGVTHFPIVPPILGPLTERAKGVCENGLKSLKQVSCGAAPLSGSTVQHFLNAFPHVDFIQGYGMTESTAVGTRGFNTKRFQKHSSVGLLAPNTEAKVVDCTNGHPLPPGGIGELWMRGPGTMKGYLNNPETTAETIDKDGWLRTGDIVSFDKDGYLYIFDRLKEMIKYNGFQIAPADLEAVLITHPDILDAAVTGRAADKDAGEIPVAFVVRRRGSNLNEEDVIKHVAAQVAPYKKVRRVVFTEGIPRSPAGKILRRELRSLMKFTPTPRL
ncbi:unnamed protein product [Linum tenue]|uniref:4-coumarate--CoA ligase n=1 Tax=Linum tenue TaxID=586396 RepID=A0AAV0KD63_9ROSI|nr:unnamed protein product [Linum tenue]